MSLYETFSVKSSAGVDSEYVRKFCVDMYEMGWKLILNGCGDVVLLFGEGDFVPSVGECEDFSFIFRVKDQKWALDELRRLKNL